MLYVPSGLGHLDSALLDCLPTNSPYHRLFPKVLRFHFLQPINSMRASGRPLLWGEPPCPLPHRDKDQATRYTHILPQYLEIT